MTHASALPRLGAFHHVAFRCRDAEETRRFYEGLLGLPLAAGLAFDEISGTDTALRYMHVFFQLGDGNYLAFFDAPDSAKEDAFKPRSGFNRHIAIAAPSLAALQQYKQHLEAHGVACNGPLDHGFVHSIYFFDPNGIQVEITAKTERHDAILDEEGRKAAADLAQWTEQTAPAKRARGLRLPA